MFEEQEIDQELMDKLVQKLTKPQINVQVDTSFATPYDAYTLLLETVRQTIPPEKIQQFVQARGQDPTLESALSVKFVYDLAFSELLELFPSEQQQQQQEQRQPPIPPPPPVQIISQPIPQFQRQPSPNQIPQPNTQIPEAPTSEEEKKASDVFDINLTDFMFDN
ncbi:hypothetical protein GPJ56_008793 [Histomonas meleagridis]|uniref:uncharacterized protein n=1 Tax=Histomonas meleagridis TaxID=135588 RepID=UPI003559C3F9|nr:hypothetical protein GPJ56_008793 [Histomonas meleagridis]KAH0805415.1 hypothetical protein GO595_001797 [Histomonas meleagridis]